MLLINVSAALDNISATVSLRSVVSDTIEVSETVGAVRHSVTSRVT